MADPQDFTMTENGSYTTKDLILRIESKIDAYITSSTLQNATLSQQISELKAREPDRERRLTSIEINVDKLSESLNDSVADPQASPAGRVISKDLEDLNKEVAQLKKDQLNLEKRVNQLFAGIAVLIFLANFFGEPIIKAVGSWLSL